MKTIANLARQGDVLCVPIKAIPASATLTTLKGDIILAQGEKTFHHHRIAKPKNRVKAYFDGLVMYLEVLEPVTVTHEEHGPINLAPGFYERRMQVETWMDEVRQVMD